MNIIAATKNEGKIREIEKIFGELGIKVISQEQAGIEIDAEETGDTFEKNALIKARAVAMLTDDIVLSDDSGLCVEALGGAPGVHSARYAGEGASDAERINKLLGEMEGVKNRSAKFVTCAAMVFPDGTEVTARGEVLGKILTEPDGENGFGYDPIFYSDELAKSFARADDDEKNSVSHRGRALRALYEIVKDAIAAKEE
ncbi:MAG: XTP/dITP diphosphatase [Clostridiales bacterium]|nr:XTP/dITP diphosphatase [Clostridiales bacterium]